jgi:dUTP pyrophosphatase
MTNSVPIAIKRLPHGLDLPLPAYQTNGAAGMDLYAAIKDPVTLEPGEYGLVPTGMSMALPSGYEAQIRPRSGLSAKHGVTVLNSPGTIDADYRGEVKVILINHGQLPFEVARGERVAQMLITPVTRGVLEEVGTLPDTLRGEGGFGSTGTG